MIVYASLSPIKKRPTRHSVWSLSERPSAKRAWPIAQTAASHRTIDFRLRVLLETRAITIGGRIELKDLRL